MSDKNIKPILFSGPMVRAILYGERERRRKTQTRRIVKPQPTRLSADAYADRYNKGRQFNFWASRGTVKNLCGDVVGGKGLSPYGDVGDTLWVRESVCEMDTDHRPPRWTYKANQPTGSDGKPDADSERCRKEYGYKWKSSIHMPKAACRIFLHVTDVRVQRVQEISEADARAEGFEKREHFIRLWDEINGAGSFDANPWVWVISFKRAEKPEGWPA
jgi:hypothetical protein